jgi:hypothetical protein
MEIAMAPEPLTPKELWDISNRLAWAGLDAELAVRDQYSLNGDDIERIMNRFGYAWDGDQEVWASAREVWKQEL